MKKTESSDCGLLVSTQVSESVSESVVLEGQDEPLGSSPALGHPYLFHPFF